MRNLMKQHCVTPWTPFVLVLLLSASARGETGGTNSADLALEAILNASSFTSLSILDNTDPLLRQLLLEDFAQTPTIQAQIDTVLNDLPLQLRSPPLLEYIERLALRHELHRPHQQETGSKTETVFFDIPLKDHPLVQTYIEFLSGRGRWFFSKWLGRSHRYIPIMRPILEKAGLPQDLVYLAMIESGFSARAHSSANAAGFWQFIPSTGSSFDLEQSFWKDDRRDFILSTQAAGRYLKHLHRRFGDWHLAWASYNAGPGRILRALRKYKESDFWSLIDNHPESIAKETRHYVPKIIAAAIIAKSPESYGFHDIKPLTPLSWKEIPVKGTVEFKRVAQKLGITEERLKTLNPSFIRGVTPPNSRSVLRVPPEHATMTAQWLKTLPQHKRFDYVPHKVRKGDTLSQIAQEYGTSIQTLKAFNRIDKPRSIRPGKVLLIPSSPGLKPPTSNRYKKAATKNKRKSAKKAHIVASGETLWSISRRYKISVKQLKEWNGRRGNGIRAGDRLYIF